MINLPVRTAQWSAGHPGRAIAGWFLFVALCVGVGLAVGGNAATTEDYRVGEAGRAEAIAAEGGLQQRPVERVLITTRSDAGRLDEGSAAAAGQELTRRMRELPEVESVGAPVSSAGGTAVRLDVTMRGAELDGRRYVEPLREQTAAVQQAHPDLRVEQTGGPSISLGIERLRGADLARTEVIALPITLITLLLVFGSVALAVVPLLLALSSIAAAVGLSMLVSHVVPDAGIGTNIILLIGLAVGVDYTLFYLKREREERAGAGDQVTPEAVVAIAAATSGRAVVLSGLAVAASSATLFLADDVIFSSIATAAVIVTLVAVLSSLTVLPALLTTIGARDARRGARRAVRGAGSGRFTVAVLGFTSRHPAGTLSVAVIAMLALATPLAGMNLTDMGRDTHPRVIPAMQTYDRLNVAFPELKAVHRVVVRADPSRAAEAAAGLRQLAARAEDDPRVAGAANLRTSPDGRISLLELAVPHHAGTDEARRSLRSLRDDYVPATVGRLAGVEVAVTGDIARHADYPEHQQRRLPLVLGALLLVTFAITVWAFRSVILGLVGVVLNVLSAAASLGLLVLVFQPTWAEGLLDFTSTGSINSRVPLFLVVILFGLSMDYQVFVISRIREAVLRGEATRGAVRNGIGSSAGVVTSAAFVMVTVFASFLSLHLLEMKQMGFVLAVAVLLDAVVIRMVILPATMLLLGERSWWPSRTRPPASVDVG
jgi:RND superfamily putative drug exporter